MQRIFNDEWSESGQIWSNPYRDVAQFAAGHRCKPFELVTARFAPCRDKMTHAEAAILNANRP